MLNYRASPYFSERAKYLRWLNFPWSRIFFKSKLLIKDLEIFKSDNDGSCFELKHSNDYSVTFRLDMSKDLILPFIFGDASHNINIDLSVIPEHPDTDRYLRLLKTL